MRIAQITDVHIGNADDRPHGIDSRAQFHATFEAICATRPDHVILTGDLSYREPNRSQYAWIAEQLSAIPCPVAILAGNHDSQEILSGIFKTHYHPATNEIYWDTIWDATHVFFLDTARGIMSETQYAWFAEGLRNTGERTMIFMHHPPIYCGVPHMDEQYAFREIPRIQELLQSVQTQFYIYCGHYHVDREITVANQQVHITPSTYFQLNANQIEFGIDHHRPGFRLISLEPTGIRSETFYV